MQMTTTVSLRTITPLFLGGADSNSCEWRPPSIKNVLRFWFRFLEGARCNGSWQEVRKRESEIFGSSDTGVASFAVRVRQPAISLSRDVQSWGHGLGYLGYGPLTGKPQRPFIAPGTDLHFDLIWRNATAKDAVLEALWCWTHLGGFGARARRAWGSLQLCQISDKPDWFRILEGSQDLAQGLKDELARLTGGSLPSSAEYTHLMTGTTLVSVHVPETDWAECLQRMDRWLREYRMPSNGHFSSDRGLVTRFLDRHGLDRAPRRIVFGLPQNYFFKERRKRGQPAQASIAPVEGGRSGRRGSPLFIRLHRLRSGEHVFVMMLVPSQFLPGVRPEIEVSARTARSQRVDASCNYADIITFLEQFGPLVTL